jgi:hypothetical protein
VRPRGRPASGRHAGARRGLAENTPTAPAVLRAAFGRSLPVPASPAREALGPELAVEFVGARHRDPRKSHFLRTSHRRRGSSALAGPDPVRWVVVGLAGAGAQCAFRASVMSSERTAARG